MLFLPANVSMVDAAKADYVAGRIDVTELEEAVARALQQRPPRDLGNTEQR